MAPVLTFYAKRKEIHCALVCALRHQLDSYSGKIGDLTYTLNLDQLNPEQLRVLATQLMPRVETMDNQSHRHTTVNEKLTYEIAQFKCYKFAKHRKQLSIGIG